MYDDHHKIRATIAGDVKSEEREKKGKKKDLSINNDNELSPLTTHSLWHESFVHYLSTPVRPQTVYFSDRLNAFHIL